jgi:hypothetical protein
MKTSVGCSKIRNIWKVVVHYSRYESYLIIRYEVC